MDDPEVRPFKTVGETTLNLHIFRPTLPMPTGGFPAVVFLSCGGWEVFEPGQFYPQSVYLASRGVVCLHPELRVVPRHGTTLKECVVDAKSAIRYIRQNAHDLGVDATRVAVGGGSAGGHVTACCGLIGDLDEATEDGSISSRPDAMILFNPVTDLMDPPFVRMFGGVGMKPWWPAFSPINHIGAGAPPTLLVHGTDDTVTRVEPNAMHFEKAMRQAGNRCDLRLYPGVGHGFFNFGRDGNLPFLKTLREVHLFLSSLGYMEGADSVDSFDFASDEMGPVVKAALDELVDAASSEARADK